MRINLIEPMDLSSKQDMHRAVLFVRGDTTFHNCNTGVFRKIATNILKKYLPERHDAHGICIGIQFSNFQLPFYLNVSENVW